MGKVAWAEVKATEKPTTMADVFILDSVLSWVDDVPMRVLVRILLPEKLMIKKLVQKNARVWGENMWFGWMPGWMQRICRCCCGGRRLKGALCRKFDSGEWKKGNLRGQIWAGRNLVVGVKTVTFCDMGRSELVRTKNHCCRLPGKMRGKSQHKSFNT